MTIHIMKLLPEDLVYCDDIKAIVTVADVFESKFEPGTYFGNEDNRNKYDTDIVDGWCEDIAREFETIQDEWIANYVSSDDYGADYMYLVTEDGYRVPEQINKAWNDELSDTRYVGRYSDSRYEYNHPALYGRKDCKNVDVWCKVHKCVEEEVYEACVEAMEMEYTSNEYESEMYEVTLDTFPIGEYEDQVEASRFWEWCENYALDNDIDMDTLHTIRYEYTDTLINKLNKWCCRIDRESQLIDDDGYFYYYGGGGAWHYGISFDQLANIITKCKVEYCQDKDSE